MHVYIYTCTQSDVWVVHASLQGCQLMWESYKLEGFVQKFSDCIFSFQERVSIGYSVSPSKLTTKPVLFFFLHIWSRSVA